MTASPTVLKAGTRPSNLALTQTRSALQRMEARLFDIRFEPVPIASVGDGDRTTDLRSSPPDFFTQALDEALRDGTIDLAIHSAKDLPDPLPDGLDHFWLPWREEPQDVLLLAPGRTVSDLPAHPIIGISSERRATYALKRFPNGIQKTIRGNIEERIAQLDQGAFDIIIMAAAALKRLHLEARITEWIPLSELPVPEGQGALAVTYRQDDSRLEALRTLFVHAVVFAGAGIGSKELCTTATLRALKQCDLCLHDTLFDQSLLDALPPGAEAIDVGKRCGAHHREQHETTQLICEQAKKGRRIVRLKGGDPGIFGRLAEETAALEALGIPFRVIPGISALQAATTSTGMLLTRRDISRGFVTLTPRRHGGGLATCDAAMKDQLPVIYYMAARAVGRIAEQMLQNGHAPDTPAALIFNAGADDEQTIRTTLAELPNCAQQPHCGGKPGLIIVGRITAYGYQTDLGALRGQRILITCSDAIQQKAIDCIHDLGGKPIRFPLIHLQPNQEPLPDLKRYDWLAITSPSSVRALMRRVAEEQIDLRTLPKIMVCGRGTAAAFLEYNIHVDAQPDSGFSAQALMELAKNTIHPGASVLRVRSDKAGPTLADALRQADATVDDLIIYHNIPIEHQALPPFDSVFFASASGVESFIKQWGPHALAGKMIVVIGKPTAKALERHQLHPTVIARESTIPGAITDLAEHLVSERITQ